ncbi:peptidogalycan biosysnthesis protein [Metallibacterium sp.]|uniref:GNAT family N-acetyltransferase n=1 Tax=Metallibacterium sp. TaxID=2940281 RepID=UPI002610706C|nr:peptidogalycan biosysnthesis protein [Metallibacterium sp.]
MTLALRILERLDTIAAADWDALRPDDNPFLSHAFLAGLEQHGCLRADWGWQAQHLGLFEDDRLVAAAPLYLKFNSHGEFVFDHAWSQALERAGDDYYPKLLCAVPYSPVVGPRLLVGAGAGADARRAALLAGLRELMLGEHLSSTHLLFLEADDLAACARDDAHWLARSDVQFHWGNRNWHTFEDFLAALRHKKRKNIRAERAQVVASGLRIEWRAGTSLDAQAWAAVHALYLDTFDAHGNLAALSADFFAHLGGALPGQVWLALAWRGIRMVAMALFLNSSSTLYGRYWGSRENAPGLHFELCYYQGIEHCLRTGLQRFEPGAQGEHKLARGFLPTLTHSRHIIAHAGLRCAVAQYLAQEQLQVRAWRDELLAHSPYAQ